MELETKYKHTQSYQVLEDLDKDGDVVDVPDRDANRPCISCLFRYRWTLSCVLAVVLAFGFVEILLNELVDGSHNEGDSSPEYEIPEYVRIDQNTSKLSGFVSLGEDGYLYLPSGEQFRMAGCNVYWLGRDENVPGEVYPSAFR